MNYFECMPGMHILGRHSYGRALSPCRVTTHPAWVEMQNTQRRLRMQALGAELARIRKAAGMPRQEDLEARSGVGVRTISDIETGKKVARINTMRKLEAALGLESGVTDDFMSGRVDSLVSDRPASIQVAATEQPGLSGNERALIRALSRRGWPAEDIAEALDELRRSNVPLPRVERRSGTDR